MATAPISRMLSHLRVVGEYVSDAELLDAYLSSPESAAFAAIVRRHGSTVLCACRQVLNQETDVEDAFQATFLVLLKNGHAIRKHQSLGSWLFGVAHRVAVNARCRRAKLDSRERTNENPPHPAWEEPDLSWREASHVLHEELNRLPDALRLPLLLCYLEGKSRDEAATALGWSLGKVKGMLERGRIKLRTRLERRGIALSAGLLAALETNSSASLPTAWVDSVVSFTGSGKARPAVFALTRGVVPVIHPVRILAAVLSVVAILTAGTLIAASTFVEPASPKKDSPAPVAKETPAPIGEQLTIKGRVIDPDGKPLAGAKLYVPFLKCNPPVSEDDVGTKVVGESSADGSFQVTIEKTEISRYLIVGSKGLGIAWVNLEKASRTYEAVVKLGKDSRVEGRVIDTEGKPVAHATVRVMTLFAPAEGKLDGFLTAWKNDWNDALRRVNDRMYMPLESIHGSGETDQDGKFTLNGIGAERIAVVEFVQKGYAKSTVYVATRPGLDAGPINKAAQDKISPALRIPGQPPVLSGPKVSIVLQGTKAIEGTVTDAVTGRPIAGIVVTSGSGYGSQVSAKSDKNGKYWLSGLEKNREYLLHTLTPDPKTPYLMWSARIRDTAGFTPIHHDIPMMKGIVLVIRLLDRSTGKPVRGYVRLAPLQDNKFFGAKPAYNGYSSERFSHSTEGDTGKLRIVTIPGTSVIMAQGEGGEMLGGKPINPFTPAVPDPEHPKYFNKNGDDGFSFSAAGNSIELLDLMNACKVVDLKPGAAEVAIDLYLERGKTAKLRVVDADGKPLEGAFVEGLDRSGWSVHRLPKDAATVYALGPDQSRTLMLIHPGRNLGGAVTIKASDAKPATAKLLPIGSIAGKLVDTDGLPIAGITVSIQFPNNAGSALFREIKSNHAAPTTGADGSFRLEGIIPGVKFYLSMTKGQMYFVGEPKIGTKQVEAGQTLELGTLPVKGRKFGE